MFTGAFSVGVRTVRARASVMSLPGQGDDLGDREPYDVAGAGQPVQARRAALVGTSGSHAALAWMAGAGGLPPPQCADRRQGGLDAWCRFGGDEVVDRAEQGAGLSGFGQVRQVVHQGAEQDGAVGGGDLRLVAQVGAAQLGAFGRQVEPALGGGAAGGDRVGQRVDVLGEVLGGQLAVVGIRLVRMWAGPWGGSGAAVGRGEEVVEGPVDRLLGAVPQ